MASVEFLMNDKSGSGLNLRAVKSRAADLRKTIDHILETLHLNPSSLQWKEVLDRYAVINVQLQQLQGQIRQILQHYLSCPRSVNQTNAPVLPILLSTKLLPEQEAERRLLLQNALAITNPIDSQEQHQTIKEEAVSRADIEEAATRAREATVALNRTIDELFQHDGPLDAKYGQRSKLAVAARDALVPRTEATSEMKRALSLPRSTFQLHGKAADGRKRDSEVLLAAACYGDGLAW